MALDEPFTIIVGPQKEVPTTRLVVSANAFFRNLIVSSPELKCFNCEQHNLQTEAVLKFLEFLTLKRAGGPFNSKAYFSKYSEFPDALLSVSEVFGEKNLVDQCVTRLMAQLQPLTQKLTQHMSLNTADLEEVMRKHLFLLQAKLGVQEVSFHDVIVKAIMVTWNSVNDVRVCGAAWMIVALQFKFPVALRKLVTAIDPNFLKQTVLDQQLSAENIQQVFVSSLSRDISRWSTNSMFQALKRLRREDSLVLLEAIFEDSILSSTSIVSALIHSFANYGDYDIVVTLLSKYKKLVRASDEHGNTFLVKMLGSTAAAQFLLALEANPEFEQPFLFQLHGENDAEYISCRPLHYAVVKGDTALVNALIQRGASLEAVSRVNPKSGREILRELADQKLELASVDFTAKYDKSKLKNLSFDFTPLAWAIFTKNDLIAKLLLEHGAQATSALPLAIQYQNLAVLESLVNAPGVVLQSKILLPVLLKSNFAAGLALLRSKLEPTPECLQQAVDWGCSAEIVQILIEMNADVNQGALHTAVSLQQTDLVRLFLSRGADPNALFQSHRPLHVAVREIHLWGREREKRSEADVATFVFSAQAQIENVILLLDAGAAVNARDGSGFSAVLLLSSLSTPSAAALIQVLISHGADLSIADYRSGQTALHLAVKSNNFEIVKCLLNAGASVSVWDRYGRAPISFSKTHSPVWELLQAKLWTPLPIPVTESISVPVDADGVNAGVVEMDQSGNMNAVPVLVETAFGSVDDNTEPATKRPKLE